MKKLLKVLLVFILALSFTACGSTKKNTDKVKVYVFEAGGCPYCEAEIQYLQSLEENGKKFEIVEKELYVDHVEWAQGKDYELGVKVADAFKNAGFTNATYTSTPFVVISDLYAVSGYSTSLDSVIDYAYKEGDMDAVSCIESGEEGCIRDIEDVSFTSSDRKTPPAGVTNSSKTSAIISVGVILAVLVFFLLKKKK